MGGRKEGKKMIQRLHEKRPLKNQSPEALELLRNRIRIYSVPRHLIPKALNLEKKSKENQ